MSTRLRDSIEAILNAHKSHGNYVYPAPELRAANMVGLLVDLHDAYRHHLGSSREALSAWIVKEFKDTGMDLQDFTVEMPQAAFDNPHNIRTCVDAFCMDYSGLGRPFTRALRSEVYAKDTWNTRDPWDSNDPSEMSRRMVAMCAPEIAAAVGRLGYPTRLRQAVLFVDPRNPMMLQWCLVLVIENTQRIVVAPDLGNPSPNGDVPVVTRPVHVSCQTINGEAPAEVEVNFSPETVRRVSSWIRPDAETHTNPTQGDIK
jgi:hypothetical protein